MIDLTEDQWKFVDELLFLNRRLPAIVFVRDSAACRLIEAMDTVETRKMALGLDFSGSAFSRVIGFANLDKVTEPICVIEGSWDGDDGGWFIHLIAIVRQPSPYHGRYTPFGLCDIRGLDTQVERAVALGEELARAAHTTFHLTSVEIDDRKRWWNLQ